ncbi:hypothetical protein HGRIS_000002 [Hohenbuehelia grisea]|uniref:Uncharacterized protein n=1 Tax=Hohenbuehelia grisea TaxID=104357 RepID=A0ABR3JPR8_9AGAR
MQAQALTALFNPEEYLMFSDGDDKRVLAPPSLSRIQERLLTFRTTFLSTGIQEAPTAPLATLPIVKGRAADDLEPGCYGEDDKVDAAGPPRPPLPTILRLLQITKPSQQPAVAGLATITREAFQESQILDQSFHAVTRSMPATPEMVVEARRVVTTPPVETAMKTDQQARLGQAANAFPNGEGRLFVAPLHHPAWAEFLKSTSYVIRCLTEACALMNKIVTTERADALTTRGVGLFHFQQRFIKTHDINPPHHELWSPTATFCSTSAPCCRASTDDAFPIQSSALALASGSTYAPHLYRVRAALVDRVLDALRELLWVKGYTHSGIRVTTWRGQDAEEDQTTSHRLVFRTHSLPSAQSSSTDGELSFLANAAAVFQFQGDTDVAGAITRRVLSQSTILAWHLSRDRFFLLLWTTLQTLHPDI